MNMNQEMHLYFSSLLGKGKPINYKDKTILKGNMDILDPV